MNNKQNKLSEWFYKQNYYLRLIIVIILFLLYGGMIGFVILGGLLAGIEYVTPILLFVFVGSLMLLIWKFSFYFFIPIIIGWIVIFLGSYELGQPCSYHFKVSSYNCDCNGWTQYKLFSERCIGDRENCQIRGEKVSCEELDNYFDNRR